MDVVMLGTKYGSDVLHFRKEKKKKKSELAGFGWLFIVHTFHVFSVVQAVFIFKKTRNFLEPMQRKEFASIFLDVLHSFGKFPNPENTIK